MASSNNPNYLNNPCSSSSALSLPFDPTSAPNTTFVQADPSTFRAVVQRLTGANQDQSTQKFPLACPTRQPGRPASGEMGPRRPPFKLHERRQTGRKLEITLNDGYNIGNSIISSPSSSNSTTPRQRSFLSGYNGDMVMASPVSPLEIMLARGSPRTPRSPMEEEERAIAEKGFYLHPSPLSTPRGSDPPELLPLFPVNSPRNDSSSS